ncbi:MAG: family 20 glycosylhydrolase [Erythrobacter sp.]
MARVLFAGSAALLLTACAGTATPSGTGATPALRSDADTIGNALDVTYRVLATRGDSECHLAGVATATPAPCYEAEITLESAQPIDISGASIYFSQVDPVALAGTPAAAAITHVNGDLHRLSLTGDAGHIMPGVARRITFTVSGSALTRAKFMPNYYVVDAAGDTALIASTQEKYAESMGRRELPFLAPLPPDARRAERDITPLETPAVTYALNAGVIFQPDGVDSGIIPRPAHVALASGGERADLSRGLAPRLRGIDSSNVEAAFARLAGIGVKRSADGLPLSLVVDETLAIAAEGYELAVRRDGIAVRASDSAGAFYALQSLAALVRPGHSDIPAVTVEDAPRFDFRGMHIDVARNFHGPETLRALIDQMAAYKLNKLHLHLADDEGWRLEIAGLPELTALGSRRCHDLAETRCLLPQLGSGPDSTTSGSGFLSESEYVDLLRYAAQRHVEVIPALDMPGHARAAVKAMDARYRSLKEQGASEEVAARFLLSDPADTTVYRSIQHYSDNTINVCRPSAYRFVEHVVDRVIELHRQAGTPLRRFHIGADETAGAWAQSPLCAPFLKRPDTPDKTAGLGGYFVARVAQLVADRGVIPAAWSDGLSHADAAQLPTQVQSNVWDTLSGGAAQTAQIHAGHGWDVIVSIPDALYFDLPYAAHPDEGGYYWAIRQAPTRKLFSMMPGDLPAMAAYWQDRDGQPIAASPLSTEASPSFAGMQGHIWTETVRDRETLGYQIFPRVFALAERAWHRAEWESGATPPASGEPLGQQELIAAIETDWNRFASIVTAKELPKLEQAGWSYRLPPPGVSRTGAAIAIVSPLPGLPVQCNAGSGWVPLEACRIDPEQPIRLRITNHAGTLFGRAVEVPPSPRQETASRRK